MYFGRSSAFSDLYYFSRVPLLVYVFSYCIWQSITKVYWPVCVMTDLYISSMLGIFLITNNFWIPVLARQQISNQSLADKVGPP